MQTLGQERAKFALRKVIEIAQNIEQNADLSLEKKKEKKKSVKSLSSSLPAMILQNGLGQTLTFLLAKKQKQFQAKELLQVIRLWLSEKVEEFNNVEEDSDLIEKLTEIDQQIYLIAQNEVLRMLEWFKRFANSEILLKENDDGSEE